MNTHQSIISKKERTISGLHCKLRRQDNLDIETKNVTVCHSPAGEIKMSNQKNPQ